MGKSYGFGFGIQITSQQVQYEAVTEQECVTVQDEKCETKYDTVQVTLPSCELWSNDYLQTGQCLQHSVWQ